MESTKTFVWLLYKEIIKLYIEQVSLYIAWDLLCFVFKLPFLSLWMQGIFVSMAQQVCSSARL
jgi:hypothetical protein